MLVHSIFESVSGEAGFFPQGTWCTFIRLQGCNLKCTWCDTPGAQKPNEKKAVNMSITGIVGRCVRRHVLITGGEPLHRDLVELERLVYALYRRGHHIQIETNGSILPPISSLRNIAKWIMDRKPPSSGMSEQMMDKETIKNLQSSERNIILKYVIATDEDLRWAWKDIRDMRSYYEYFILSPLGADLSQASHILEKVRNSYPTMLDRMVLSVQLHKLLNVA